MALIGSNGLCQNEISQRFTDLVNYQLIKLDIADLWNSQTSTFDPQLIDHFLSVHAFTPCLLHITNFGMFGKRDGTSEQELCTIQKLAEFFHNMSSSVVALLEITNSEYLSIPESIKSQLCFEISLVDLQETDRYEIFYHYTSCSKTSTQLSKNTLGFGYNELMKVIEEASLHFNFKKYSKKEKIYLSRKPDLCDYLYAIEKRNKCLVSSIGVPTIPNVQWADIGGLEETKALLEESLGISKKRKNENVKRSGIVLYGPPGCGKTMIAKAVANEFNITFLSVKGPELLNQYIGQSEENVRKLFEKARQASPCIIFLDEMDSLAPAKGRSGDSGGVMDRVVSQLLSELDIVNCTKNCQVFVMAATNRPDLLNQTLLSPGRFDKTVYVEPSNDVSSKLKVLEAVTRKVKLSPSVNLEKIANLLPPVMSGADIYSLVSNAVMELLRQQIKALQNGQTIEDVTKLVVEDDHIQSVIKKVMILERAHGTIETDSNISSEIDVDKIEKGIGTDYVSIKRHQSFKDNEMITDLKMSDVNENVSSGVSSGDSLYQSIKEMESLSPLESNKISGLGFSISPNDTEGIRVLSVDDDSEATHSGAIFSGDRIKLLTISFENMLYDDAIKLLHYASPYLIKLDLERNSPVTEIEEEDNSASESVSISILLPKVTVRVEKEVSENESPNSTPESSESTDISNIKMDVPENVIHQTCLIFNTKKQEDIEVTVEIDKQEYKVERSESTDSATTISSLEFNDAENGLSSITFSEIKQVESSMTPSVIEIIKESPVKSMIPQRAPSIKSRPPSPSKLPTPTKSPRRLTDTNINISRTPSLKEPIVRKLDLVAKPPSSVASTIQQSFSSSSSSTSSILSRTNNSSPELKQILTTTVPPTIIAPPPEFELMVAETYKRKDTPPKITIIERELPPLPHSISNTPSTFAEENKITPGKMYLQMRSKLREVYSTPTSQENYEGSSKNDTSESIINEERCQELLERNQRYLEDQKKQLQDLGLNLNK
uniref:PDZ domain-containing protein n=1 Tax=Rhabditophanes sp. KR3021 TaxID=114890 RepID=A0AC35UFG0_9BILA